MTSYEERKRRYDSMLTVYGRKPVLEALRRDLDAFRLHVLEGVRGSAVVEEILATAERRGIEVVARSRASLSRISGNARQDQGVALDLRLPGYRRHDGFLAGEADFRLLALDGITNPQNLGMIIRSVSAVSGTGVLLPEKGCAPIDPLVVKASAGTLFTATIVRCVELVEALAACREAGSRIVGVDHRATVSIVGYSEPRSIVYVLGNESEGLSMPVADCCDEFVGIPMTREVESLNVGVAAAIVAYSATFNVGAAN